MMCTFYLVSSGERNSTLWF